MRRASLGVANAAIRADQIDGALDHQAAGPIQLAHLLARIDQQRERKAAVGLEPSAALGALWVYAEHQRVDLLRGRPTIAKLAQLPAADSGVVRDKTPA